MDLTEGVGESSSPPRSFGSFNSYDVRNNVFNRLVETGHEEAISNPDFRDYLDSHFNRLPASYGLDVNMDRVEDVLLHQKLLASAKDPEKRPVYHIRFLEGKWIYLIVFQLLVNMWRCLWSTSCEAAENWTFGDSVCNSSKV